MLDYPEPIPHAPALVRLYGVWLPAVGWLRGPEHKIFGVEDIELAKQTAKWFGGQVLIMDDEYQDFEAQMLEAEKRKRRKYGLFAKRH